MLTVGDITPLIYLSLLLVFIFVGGEGWRGEGELTLEAPILKCVFSLLFSLDCHVTSWRNFIKHPDISSLVIISSILISCRFGEVVIL